MSQDNPTGLLAGPELHLSLTEHQEAGLSHQHSTVLVAASNAFLRETQGFKWHLRGIEKHIWDLKMRPQGRDEVSLGPAPDGYQHPSPA